MITAEEERKIRMDQAEDTLGMIANLVQQIKTGKIKGPHSGGSASGSEIVAKIDAAIGTDWKSGTALEVIADIEAATSITMTGPLSATNVAATAAAPGDNTASVVVIGQKDSSVGTKATLDIETEEVVASGALTTDKTLAIWVNGVEYQIGLKAV